MTKEFWKAALIRAIRTICQTAIATIGTTAVLEQVDWILVLSSSALAGLLSILNSVATGLPEAQNVPAPGAHEVPQDPTIKDE